MAIINPLANTSITPGTMLRQQPGTFPVQLRPGQGAAGWVGYIAALDFSGGVPPLTVNPPNLADTGNPVTNGTNLQAALTAATIGTTIVVQAGVEYRKAGAYTFPAQGASWDMRRTTLTSTRSPQLPAGTRVSGADVAKFATLTTSAKSATLDFSNARGWTLSGLEVSYTNAAQTGSSSSLQLVAFNGASQDLTLDRCWLHTRESVTAPTSVFRAVSDGITGIQAGTANIALLNSTVEGFVGWGYDHQQNWTGALHTQGGTHLRVKNNFLQGYRTWYLEPAATDDVVIQGNTFDAPIAWESFTDPASGSPFFSDDHRHLIIYAGTNILTVGNTFTGATRGSWGIFFDQAPSGLEFANIRYLSNFIDGLNGKTHLCMLVLAPHSPYSGHDLSFVNNLIRSAVGPPSGYETAWSTETQGPSAGAISPTKSLTATHGVNFLHNTVRRTYNYITYPHTVPHNFYDFRYNIGNLGNYGLNLSTALATDYPGLVFGPKNNWIDSAGFGYSGGGYNAYLPFSDYMANDAAVGFFNIGAADGGGAITGFALTASAPGFHGADLGQDIGCDIPTLQAALANTSTDWDYPELPRATVDLTYVTPTGTRWPSSGAYTTDTQFQNALDNANPGDWIVLQAGSTFTNNFFPRPRGSTGAYIYVQSSALASLPAPGTRVTPANAANMPKIVTPNSDPAIWAYSDHWRFVGLEITTTFAANNTLVRFDSFDQSLASMPHHLILDRCYVHGMAAGNKRGLELNCASGGVVDCWFQDFKMADRSDTQAIWGYNGPGPFTIVNNHLEASAENIMFGGLDPIIPQLVPSDITFRNNHCFKPLAWNEADSVNFAGVSYAVKNLFELKNAQRVLVEGNLFENFWYADQDQAITMTVRSQNWSAPWSRIWDVTFRRNTFTNITQGRSGWAGFMVFMGDDNESFNGNGTITQQTARILVQHNNFGACGGHAFHIDAGPARGFPHHVMLDHNTVTGCERLIWFRNDPGNNDQTCTDFVCTNNVFAHGGGSPGGIQSSSPHFAPGTTPPQQILAWHCPRYLFRNNIIIGSPNTSPTFYPPLTDHKANAAAVGFIDFAGGNYQLSTSSSGYRAGWEGLTLGFEP